MRYFIHLPSPRTRASLQHFVYCNSGRLSRRVVVSWGFCYKISPALEVKEKNITMVFKEDYPKFEETAPDDFDPAKPYADPVAFIEQREHLVREKFVEIEKAKILRERLQQCYWREGVNHVFKCRSLVKKYMDSLKNLNWGKDNRPHYLKE